MDVIGWDSASGDSLRTLGSDGTTVKCTSGGLTKELMPNEPRLLDLLAAARDRNGRLMRTIAKCSRQHIENFVVGSHRRWSRSEAGVLRGSPTKGTRC